MIATDLIIKLAPYASAVMAVFVSYLSYRETKRKTRHDELSDLYDKVYKDNERLRKENERLNKQNDKLLEENADLTQKLEALKNATH